MRLPAGQRPVREVERGEVVTGVVPAELATDVEGRSLYGKRGYFAGVEGGVPRRRFPGGGVERGKAVPVDTPESVERAAEVDGRAGKGERINRTVGVWIPGQPLTRSAVISSKVAVAWNDDWLPVITDVSVA